MITGSVQFPVFIICNALTVATLLKAVFKLVHLLCIAESPSMSPNPTLKDLAIIPIVESQWYSLGIRLGLENNVLDSINAKHSNPNRCKWEMFKRWLQVTPNPSWSTLLTALEGIGATDISKRVQREYDLPPPPPPPMAPQPTEEDDVDAGFVEVGVCLLLQY